MPTPNAVCFSLAPLRLCSEQFFVFRYSGYVARCCASAQKPQESRMSRFVSRRASFFLDALVKDQKNQLSPISKSLAG
jgi:hypothetical protein